MSRIRFLSAFDWFLMSCCTMDCVITSSPTISIMSSSFLVSTRMFVVSVTCSACFLRAWETCLGVTFPSDNQGFSEFFSGSGLGHLQTLLKNILRDVTTFEQDFTDLLHCSGLALSTASTRAIRSISVEISGLSTLLTFPFQLIPQLTDHGF